LTNFPHFDPEAISVALFTLLQTAAFSFQSTDRRGQVPENVPPASQPYMGLVELGASQVESQAQGLEKWLLHYRVLVYIRADAIPTAIPATEINAAFTAIANVLRNPTNLGGEKQTLGGLVDNVTIRGDVLIDTGIIDQQCVLMVPLVVDVGL
jgi:hypothetical protein